MTRTIFVIFILFFYSFSYGHIIKTSDIQVIEQQFNQADEKTLVIFDVDNVLLVPTDQVFQPKYQQNRDLLDFQLLQWVGQTKIEQLWSIYWEQCNFRPVDAKMIQLIKNLQSKNIKVVALTHCPSGQFGKIRSLKDWRYEQLKKNQYLLDASWNGWAPKTFDDLKNSKNKLSHEMRSTPMFYKGIIFTEVAKGEALEAFLNYVKWIPQKIIFIDDRRKNLESVEHCANSKNINCVGIEYTKAFELGEKELLNQRRADLQFKVLKEQERWLSDDDADALLASSCL